MLCYCSRRSGASSYGEICRSAFGTKAEIGVNWVLFVYLLFVIAAFMVLIRDIKGVCFVLDRIIIILMM